MSHLNEGISAGARLQMDARLHILHPLGGEWRTWCRGGPAYRENTARRRRCPECTNLLREGVAEEMYSPDDLDAWLASTQPIRRTRQ